MSSTIEAGSTASPRVQSPVAGNVGVVNIVDLGDRLRVTVDLPVETGGRLSRRRTLARAWEALAAAISQTKAALPPMPASPRPARGRGKGGKSRGARTGSGSWWGF